MGESYLTINAQLGAARREVIGGVEYFVAPVTSIVPGVLPGSKGPLYYPPSEIQRNVRDWDDVPITLHHPYDEFGNPTSADNAPNQKLGYTRKSTYNGKLRHEALIDVARAQKFAPQVHHALSTGTPMEVSTGLYTDNEQARPGSHHNGKSYTHVARNYRPDHIAILPNQPGACSLNDGCGLMVNSQSPERGMTKNSIFERFLNWFTANQEVENVQPRHPTKGHFQGMASTAAGKGYGTHAGEFATGHPVGDAPVEGRGSQTTPDGRQKSEVAEGADANERPTDDHNSAGGGTDSPDSDSYDEVEGTDPDNGKVKNANPEGHNQYTGGKGNVDSARSVVRTAGAKHVQSERAVSASRDADKVLGGHEKAASAHDQAATFHSSFGRQVEAGAHRILATFHRSRGATNNAKKCPDCGKPMSECDCEGNVAENALNFMAVLNEFASDEQRRAFFGVMGGDTSRGAHEATAKANKTGSKAHHKEAAVAHRDAANEHSEMGNESHAQAHREMAKHHTSAARRAVRNSSTEVPRSSTKQGEVPMTKNELEQVINACTCATTKATLQKLALNTPSASGSGSATVQVGDEENTDHEEGENANDSESKDVFTAKVAKVGGGKLKGKKVENADSEFIEYGKRAMNRDKLALARRLVANIADPERQRVVGNSLMQKSISELETLVELLPTPKPVQNAFTTVDEMNSPLFLGASAPLYGPVINEAPTINDDVRAELAGEPQTINYQELVLEHRGGFRAAKTG